MKGTVVGYNPRIGMIIVELDSKVCQLLDVDMGATVTIGDEIKASIPEGGWGTCENVTRDANFTARIHGEAASKAEALSQISIL